MDTLDDWLLPHLAGVRSTGDWKALDITSALKARLTWEQQQELDRNAPAHFETPLGRRVAIDYSGETPGIALRLQEMFGVTRHPTVGGQPLQVTLLSPAQRPVQVTMDIPGFWASSYGDVRKDMRGRYPRHPWPEDPTVAYSGGGEFQRDAVNAMPLARRLGPVIKDMAQMAAATVTMHLGPAHEKAVVGHRLDRIF